MGLRFHRSIKLLPGIRLNFGKRGISTSVGVRGAHVTFGKTGTSTTVGLPGSGLSYTHMEESRTIGVVPPASSPSLNSSAAAAQDWRGLLWIALIVISVAASALQSLP
jgi:uncharacterized protein DUF4236